MDMMYTSCNEAWGYFVEGAPVFIDCNINPILGLANGTSCVQDSIVLSGSTNSEAFQNDFNNTAAGDFVTIDLPEAVNIKLLPETMNRWPMDAPCARTEGAPIVPIFRKRTK